MPILLAPIGTVRDSEGRPRADVLVYAYQTDARGIYSPGGESAPRIFGFARTDAEGRYGLHTIRPGHYPDPEEPVEEHVHLELTPPDGPMTIARLGFADDPHWTGPGWKGRALPQWAVPVERAADGTQRCVLDIRLP